jgi:hypothetical protein
MINKEECGRKWSWPNVKYYPRICLKELGTTTKTLGYAFESDNAHI